MAEVKRHAFSLQLTERCNLACHYCYVRRRPDPDPLDCTPEFCERFIDFACREADGPVKITFFGGEPLLRPDLIRQMVAYARTLPRAIGFHLITNGTLLDDAMGDFIAAHGIGLEVSLDGPQAIHDAHRVFADGAPSFHEVHNRLLRFVERHPNHPVFIFSVATSPAPLPWLQAFCRAIDARGFTYNPVRRPKEEMARETNGDDDHERMAALLEAGPVHLCEAGINATVTTCAGDIYPCPFFVGHADQVIGTIAQGFQADKVKPYLNRYRAARAACVRCGARRVCVAGCAFEVYERAGRVAVPAKTDCRQTRAGARRLGAATLRMAAAAPEKLIQRIAVPPKPARAAALHPVPHNFVVRLTGRCNLACDYCYEQGHRERADLDRATALRIARHILESPATEPLVGLFGGEPLLNWEIGELLIEEIARGARRIGKRPFFHLTTNGTLLTPEIARTVARHAVTVQVSVDGPPERHDRHRKYRDGRGSWEAMHRGIERLRQADPAARIDGQVVLTPDNLDMIATVRHLKQMGLRRISFLTAGWQTATGLTWLAADITALMQARADFFPFFMASALRGAAEVDMGFASLVAAEPDGPAGICECGAGEIFIDTHGAIHRCPQLYAAGHPPIGQCGPICEEKQIGRSDQAAVDAACRACWAFARCGGGCMVRNQRCPWMASPAPRHETLWCDLLRAEFGRAMLAYRLLQSRRPRANAAIKAMFGA
ncbi:MAG: radical SAM protein [Desulfobacterales bacterium]|nr:radical SAM protein [Desulfobacterales bacterium]